MSNFICATKLLKKNVIHFFISEIHQKIGGFVEVEKKNEPCILKIHYLCRDKIYLNDFCKLTRVFRPLLFIYKKGVCPTRQMESFL